MASKHHTDEVFTEKKRPKRPIKFNVQLNEEQKEAKAKILKAPITVIKGIGRIWKDISSYSSRFGSALYLSVLRKLL